MYKFVSHPKGESISVKKIKNPQAVYAFYRPYFWGSIGMFKLSTWQVYFQSTTYTINGPGNVGKQATIYSCFFFFKDFTVYAAKGTGSYYIQ